MSAAADRAIQHSLQFAVRKLPNGRWQGWATSERWECYRQANDPEGALALAVDACIKITKENPELMNGLRVDGVDERKALARRSKSMSTDDLMKALNL